MAQHRKKVKKVVTNAMRLNLQKKQIKVYAIRVAAGLCPWCAKKNESLPKILCAKCREISNVSVLNIYKRRKEQGRCVHCGDHHLYTAIRCYECSVKHNESMRKARAHKRLLEKAGGEKVTKVVQEVVQDEVPVVTQPEVTSDQSPSTTEGQDLR